MCSSWGFKDYCQLSNAPIVNAIEYYEPNNSQTIRPKSNKNYYNDDYVYLSATLEMNHSVKVSIQLCVLISVLINIYFDPGSLIILNNFINYRLIIVFTSEYHMQVSILIILK